MFFIRHNFVFEFRCLILTLMFLLVHHDDVCLACYLLKKGGLKEENIIVFMYDDITSNEEDLRVSVS